MRTKIKLLKKISLDNLGKIVSQPLNKSFQNFKKKGRKKLLRKLKKKKLNKKNNY